MLSPEFLIRLYRMVRSRRLKAGALKAMRLLGIRWFVLRLDTTNLCNLRCRMCYYSWQKRQTPVSMDVELFEKIAREVLPVTRCLYLSCATEPLMNKDFLQFLRLAGTSGVPFTSICTNGMLLREPVAETAIQTGLSEIIFSIDGATRATYEDIRCGAKWDRLLDALTLLRVAKKKAGVRKPVVRINFTCMKRNIQELPQMVRLAEEHGVHSVHVRHLLAPGPDDAEAVFREELSYRDLFNDVAAEARETAKAAGVDLVLPEPVGKSPDAALSGTSRKREANAYCVLPWLQGFVSPAGDYRVCDQVKNVGNLRKESFRDIFDGPVLREVRRRLLHRCPESCSWNCREEAFLDTPDRGDTQDSTR